jgi:hypothetical protein
MDYSVCILFTKYYQDNNIKEEEMGGICVACTVEMNAENTYPSYLR